MNKNLHLFFFYLICKSSLLVSCQDEVNSLIKQNGNITDYYDFHLDESLNFTSNFMIFSDTTNSSLTINKDIEIVVMNESIFIISQIVLNYTCTVDKSTRLFQIRDNSTLTLLVFFHVFFLTKIKKNF